MYLTKYIEGCFFNYGYFDFFHNTTVLKTFIFATFQMVLMHSFFYIFVEQFDHLNKFGNKEILNSFLLCDL